MAGAESYFQRYGIASLLVGRFIGPLRPMLPMVAGMCDMPFPRFFAVSLLAAAGWSLAYLLPGWATGAAFRLPLPEGFWLEAGIVAASIAVMVGLSVNSSVRRHRRATIWIGGMSLLILIGLFIGYPYLTALDNGVMTLVQEHRQPALDEIAVTLTLIGEFRNMLLFSALLVILLLLCKQWRQAVFAGATMLITAMANTGTKYFFARVRPEVLSDPLTTYSMPSGHASGAFALFLTLGVLAGRGQPPRMRLTWLLIACIPAFSIALSRVYLGAHWPTDILAGAMLASCVCAAMLWLNQRQAPLNAMPFKIWWLILPSMVALFGFFVMRHLPHTLLRYAY
jgi:undecaprenyl-diphosphatase